MTADSTTEWYRFTCTRCSAWWITHYQVRRFTDDAGVPRTFYRHGGMLCEAPAHADLHCPVCHHATVRAELLDHPAADTAPQQAVRGQPRGGGLPAASGASRPPGGPGYYAFRALVTLDEPGHRASGQYPSGTHALMVRAPALRRPALLKYFSALIFTDDGRPLRPGDRHGIVTIVISDDDAPDFLGPGQAITLWDGTDAGHGTITRRTFTWPRSALRPVPGRPARRQTARAAGVR